MGLTKRCFSTVEALRRLDPQVLRDTLAQFPEYCTEHGVALPNPATEYNLDYCAIRAALMGDAVPESLDDILFLASVLGNSADWEMVERQAKEDGLVLPPIEAKHGYVDMALRAAIHEWPKNQGLLERAKARSRVHSKSSYIYYAPMRDLRARSRIWTGAPLMEARDALASHFIQQGLLEDAQHSRATEIIPYEFENEIWFLIRYPDKQSRHSGCTRSGDWSNFVFNPENYDAVVYNKVYGDLRMNTKRKRDHVKYRIVFGHLLFDEANVFSPNEKVVMLEPLLSDSSVELFNCKDIPELAMIAPVEICYEQWGAHPQKFTKTALNDDTLLEGNPHSPRILPKDTLTVYNITLIYRLKDLTKTGKIKLQLGNRVTFERDGDSLILEKWLRKREFVKNFVRVQNHDNLEEDWPIAVGQ